MKFFSKIFVDDQNWCSEKIKNESSIEININQWSNVEIPKKFYWKFSLKSHSTLFDSILMEFNWADDKMMRNKDFLIHKTLRERLNLKNSFSNSGQTWANATFSLYHLNTRIRQKPAAWTMNKEFFHNYSEKFEFRLPWIQNRIFGGVFKYLQTYDRAKAFFPLHSMQWKSSFLSAVQWRRRSHDGKWQKKRLREEIIVNSMWCAAFYGGARCFHCYHHDSRKKSFSY